MSTDQAPDWIVPTEFPPAVPEPCRHAWGALPNQTWPGDWMARFTQIVYAEYPGVFRAILPRLYGLPDEPKRGRKAGNA